MCTGAREEGEGTSGRREERQAGRQSRWADSAHLAGGSQVQGHLELCNDSKQPAQLETISKNGKEEGEG